MIDYEPDPNSPEDEEHKREAGYCRDRMTDAVKLLRKKEFKKALFFAPKKMTFRDNNDKAWRLVVALKTHDSQLIGFAKRWARLMEGCIARGESIEECAEKCFRLANTENLPNSIYREAVLILWKTQWIHGEELDHWYNKPTTQAKNVLDESEKRRLRFHRALRGG